MDANRGVNQLRQWVRHLNTAQRGVPAAGAVAVTGLLLVMVWPHEITLGTSAFPCPPPLLAVLDVVEDRSVGDSYPCGSGTRVFASFVSAGVSAGVAAVVIWILGERG